MNKKKEYSTMGINVVACRKINNHAISMMVSSAMPLNKENVSAFVYASTDYALSPYHESYTDINKNNNQFYASVIGYRLPYRMRIDNNSKMVKLTASTYLDSNIDEVWEKTEVDGKAVFFRKNDLPIENIADTLMTGSVNPDKEDVPFISATKGDVVEAFFLSSKGTPRTIIGRVADVVEDKVVISTKDKTYTVMSSSVYNNLSAEEAMNYLKLAYSRGHSPEYEHLIEEMFNGVRNG